MEKEVEEMIRLVACDLDGTLLDEQHEIPKENAEAIKRLQNAGIQFITTTGRTYDSVVPLLETHGIACEHLLVNGAVMKDRQGATFYENPMQLSHVHQVMDILQGEDLCFNLYTSEGSLTPNIEKAKQEFITHMMMNGMKEEDIIEVMERHSFCRYDREIHDMASYLKEQPVIYKMETFGGTQEAADRVRKKLGCVKGLALSDSISKNVEITEYTAQKGFTLKKYCESKGIGLDEVIVMGDSMNDLSMMQMFPHSIAVGNASDRIKEAASYVTKSNQELAVAYVINQLMSIIDIQKQ